MSEQLERNSSLKSSTKRQRISATDRREQMLHVAVDLARNSGVNYLTLARVAEASGVSKPIAYQHFGSISQLLQEMFEIIGSEYEQSIREALFAPQYQNADPIELIRLFCETYIDQSLGEQALYDEVGASLISVVDEARSQRVDVAEKYAPFVVDLFNLGTQSAYNLMVAFLGAIDRICDAVIAKRIDRNTAIDLLMDIFIPALKNQENRSLEST